MDYRRLKNEKPLSLFIFTGQKIIGRQDFDNNSANCIRNYIYYLRAWLPVVLTMDTKPIGFNWKRVGLPLRKEDSIAVINYGDVLCAYRHFFCLLANYLTNRLRSQDILY